MNKIVFFLIAGLGAGIIAGLTAADSPYKASSAGAPPPGAQPEPVAPPAVPLEAEVAPPQVAGPAEPAVPATEVPPKAEVPATELLGEGVWSLSTNWNAAYNTRTQMPWAGGADPNYTTHYQQGVVHSNYVVQAKIGDWVGAVVAKTVAVRTIERNYVRRVVRIFNDGSFEIEHTY